MPNRNRKLVGRKSEKGKKKKWIKSTKLFVSKFVEQFHKFYCVVLCIPLVALLFLIVILGIELPNDVNKWLILFYMFCIGFLIVLIIISEYRREKVPIAVFKDASWLSYIAFVIVETPVVMMLLYTLLVAGMCKLDVDAEKLLQIVYWSIAISHLIWVSYHIKVRDIDHVKINLMLKLMVVIISGLGLVMDIVSKISFTKQFLVIAWTVLLMSYISDKRQSSNLENEK